MRESDGGGGQADDRWMTCASICTYVKDSSERRTRKILYCCGDSVGAVPYTHMKKSYEHMKVACENHSKGGYTSSAAGLFRAQSGK